KRMFENFNMSLCVDDKFFESFFNNKNYDLHFNNKIYDSINAKDLMEMITNNVYSTGDPGMIFYNTINKDNLLLPVFGYWVSSTNPCGEQILYPNDSCNLGSINLAKFVTKDGKFDAIEFMNVCNFCTQFLDGVIDANKYPIPKINEVTKKCRRIGLGFMGLADLFNQLGIQYNSEIGFTLAEYISAIMTGQALKTSSFIAGFKGSFPYYNDERYKENREKLPLLATKENFESLKERIDLIKSYLSKNSVTEIDELYSSIPISDFGLRNCNVTTIAPTGTLSMFVDCSSGIEPTYSHGYKKSVTVGDFYYVNKYLEDRLKDLGLYSKDILEEIIVKNNGTISNIDVIPQEVKDIFVTAMDIHPFDHLAIQGLCQRWISNSISKTINAPNNISQKQIEHCYILSYKFGCRGTTIYRDGSKHTQVLNNNSFNSHRNLKVSDFTLRWIEDLDVPQLYKEEIINYIGSHNQQQETSNIKEINCSKCNSSNSIISNGSTCSICKSCGELIGCNSI
ncbi:MAG TPA: adenosylcobalamin-dependent ribonucleoside-diphosphate reductase, partial [Candidatus Nitrosocosmicus sp.]|nr:adenosylcobalamin-dependent ribonucleoside-diphosphate reductase [Candidatus Nitrosocosmicus sp.]